MTLPDNKQKVYFDEVRIGDTIDGALVVDVNQHGARTYIQIKGFGIIEGGLGHTVIIDKRKDK